MAELLVVRAGVVDYTRAWAWQRQLHARRVAGELPDTVLLLEHPSVYTAGRRTEPAERPTDGTPVIDTDRGGKLTWHGPGQLVGYPIVELPGIGGSDRLADVVGHVRRIEESLIEVCRAVGVTALQVPGRTGVWVEGRPQRKIAAVGVRVASRVTLHGFALNVAPDLAAFTTIIPCGISDASVTSLAAETGNAITVEQVLPVVENALAHHLPATGIGVMRRPARLVCKDLADLGLSDDAALPGVDDPAAGSELRPGR